MSNDARLFGAGDRLMDETGYRWRFPSERRRHDEAVALARADLGAEADHGRSTVKTHLEHVFTKTGVRNRSELTVEASAAGAPDRGGGRAPSQVR